VLDPEEIATTLKSWLHAFSLQGLGLIDKSFKVAVDLWLQASSAFKHYY